MRPFARSIVALCAFASRAPAQVTDFTSPGMPPGAAAGMDQTDRFSNDFNPGIGFVLDMVGGYYDFGASAEEDGLDFDVRTFEMTPAGYIDPSTFGWASVVWEPDEGVELEEATIVYSGTPLNTSLRAGIFFIDFGKQMQAHVHDLRTVDRPLVLREYLGVEAPGTGIQWDQWFAASSNTTVRYSLGILTDLGGTFEVEEDTPDAATDEVAAIPNQAGFKDLGQLDFTGRITGFSDFGEGAHLLQYGGSARFVPEYELTSDVDGVAPVSDLSNTVWGLDLTYGWQNDTGDRGFATGLEWLWSTGDLGGTVVELPDTSEAIQVLDGTADGFYGWGEYRFAEQRHALGAQWSRAQSVQSDLPGVDEYDLYYTWNVTEMNRIRFALTMNDPDDGERSWRAAVQLTAFLGPHSHGVNW